MKKILLIAFLSGISYFSIAQWHQTGPYGGQINCMTSLGSKIFAGTENGGVYSSFNNGNSWQVLDTNMEYESTWSMYTFGNKIIIGTFGFTYLSNDSGSTWSVTSSVGNFRAFCNFDSLVIAGTFHGVYISSDSGSTWIGPMPGLPTDLVYSVASNRGKIFAGTDMGLFVSSDTGSSWTMCMTRQTYSLIVFGNTVLAGVPSEIKLSTDTGFTWTSAVGVPPGFPLLTVMGSKIFAFYNGVYVSSDSGYTWTPVGTSTLGNRNILTLMVKGNNLFAGTFYDGVFLSVDSGNSWNVTNYGLSNSDVMELAASGDTLFAGTHSQGIFYSPDLGVTWPQGNNALNNNIVLSIAINGMNLFAGTNDSGLYSSSNSGLTWNPINTIGGNTYIHFVETIDSTLYVALNFTDFLQSTDVGNTWSPVSGLSNIRIDVLCIDSSGYYAGTAQGIFISRDHGVTWDTTNHSIPSGNNLINDIKISGGNILVATDYGLYASVDSGRNWIVTNPVAPNDDFTSLAVYGGNVFAGNDHAGVFLSTDNGINWITINDGLPFKRIRKVFAYDNKIYAGTMKGSIFFRDINQILNIDNTRIENTEITLYPNPAHEYFNISFKQGLGLNNYDIKIFNLFGELVFSERTIKYPSSNFHINFKAGIYFVSLSNGNHEIVKKMVVR